MLVMEIETCNALLSVNVIKQQTTCKVANSNFTFYDQKKLQTLNLFVTCNLPSLFHFYFINVYVVGCALSSQLCSLCSLA